MVIRRGESGGCQPSDAVFSHQRSQFLAEPSRLRHRIRPRCSSPHPCVHSLNCHMQARMFWCSVAVPLKRDCTRPDLRSPDYVSQRGRTKGLPQITPHICISYQDSTSQFCKVRTLAPCPDFSSARGFTSKVMPPLFPCI